MFAIGWIAIQHYSVDAYNESTAIFISNRNFKIQITREAPLGSGRRICFSKSRKVLSDG